MILAVFVSLDRLEVIVIRLGPCQLLISNLFGKIQLEIFFKK